MDKCYEIGKCDFLPDYICKEIAKAVNKWFAEWLNTSNNGGKVGMLPYVVSSVSHVIQLLAGAMKQRLPVRVFEHRVTVDSSLSSNTNDGVYCLVDGNEDGLLLSGVESDKQYAGNPMWNKFVELFSKLLGATLRSMFINNDERMNGKLYVYSVVDKNGRKIKSEYIRGRSAREVYKMSVEHQLAKTPETMEHVARSVSRAIKTAVAHAYKDFMTGIRAMSQRGKEINPQSYLFDAAHSVSRALAAVADEHMVPVKIVSVRSSGKDKNKYTSHYLVTGNEPYSPTMVLYHEGVGVSSMPGLDRVSKQAIGFYKRVLDEIAENHKAKNYNRSGLVKFETVSD